MNYKIIATGSSGNALVINNVLIDCGVSFAKLKDYYKSFDLVLLTHIHSDHFNKTTIKMLAEKRPTLRFGCCKWLVDDLIKCGVSKKNIDVYIPSKKYSYYNDLTISPVLLYHNVDQCGYRVFINDKKILYCTDTNTLKGIEAKNYDYYFIEANYITEEIKKIIKEKEEKGQYCYEYDAMYNHLSKEKADEFLMANMGNNSHIIYMHQSKNMGTYDC